MTEFRDITETAARVSQTLEAAGIRATLSGGAAEAIAPVLKALGFEYARGRRFPRPPTQGPMTPSPLAQPSVEVTSSLLTVLFSATLTLVLLSIPRLLCLASFLPCLLLLRLRLFVRINCCLESYIVP